MFGNLTETCDIVVEKQIQLLCSISYQIFHFRALRFALQCYTEKGQCDLKWSASA